MSLFVNTNVSALNAQRQLINSGNGLSQAFQRLSSGFRINSAADDAAGLQISNRLTGQINGLNQGISNANDAISVAQVAEGALDEVTTALQRMRVLSVQAENGINSPEDREALQKEVLALQKEIDRIATTTEFAGTKLLDGNFNRSFLVGANAGEHIDLTLTSFGNFSSEGLWVSEIDVRNEKSQSSGERGYIGSEHYALGPKRQYQDNDTLATVTFMPGQIATIEGISIKVGNNPFVKIPAFTSVAGDPDAFINAVHQATGIDFLDTASVPGNPSDTRIFFTRDIDFQISVDGLSPNLLEAQEKASDIFSRTGFSDFNFGTMPYGDSDFNMSIIDRAIEKVDSARAYLGAIQNRFQSAIRNLTNVTENVSAARSRIRDADFAKETAELTRWQILQQAGTTILSQANQRPQAALNLLG